MGSIVLACPLKYINQGTSIENNGDIVNVERGMLVIPIKLHEEEEIFTVFVPCGGPDPETDELPEDVGDIPLSCLLSWDIKNIPGQFGRGLMDGISGEDYTSVLSDQVKENDFINVVNKDYKVMAVGPDAFHNIQKVDVIRIHGAWKHKINQKKFKIKKKTFVKGKLIDIASVLLSDYHPIIISHQYDENNIGNFKLSYYNAEFNTLGFLCHDVAISI